MCEAGLSIGEMHQAESLMEQINQSKLSGREALKEFLEIHRADESFLEIGLKEYENPSIEMPIDMVEGALEVLDDLKVDHKLAIVTMGKHHLQLAKMKKAGIDLSLFSRIVIAEDQNKKIHYQRLLSELKFSSTEVVVCGDRIHIDLTPAKELGFKTVHLKHGRGLNSFDPKSDVDFTIFHLREIKKIISQIRAL